MRSNCQRCVIYVFRFSYIVQTLSNMMNVKYDLTVADGSRCVLTVSVKGVLSYPSQGKQR